MNMNQYIGCVIIFRGRPAEVIGATDCYEGSRFTLRFEDGETLVIDAFDMELMEALPDPEEEPVRKNGDDVTVSCDGETYVLKDHPYEPCLYVKKDGITVLTLHNAFTADSLYESFSSGETVKGIDGRDYGETAFTSVLFEALGSGRDEMNFTFAAELLRKRAGMRS